MMRVLFVIMRGGLVSLLGTLMLPSMVDAREGQTHVPGIFMISDDHWVRRISLGGLVETDYNSAETFSGEKTGDITLSTVELALDARINDKVNAHLSFLYEEDLTPFEVDEGYINFTLGPVIIQAGQQYVPFGSFETNLISDPVTLQIAETRESALQFGTELGHIQAAAYVFNGTTRESGAEDVADQMGARLAYVVQGRHSGVDIGIDYINNIADSKTISAYLEEQTPSVSSLQAYVPARIAHANLKFGNVYLIAEHLLTDQFASNEIAFNGKGAELTATNLEAGYNLMIAGVDSTIAVAWQTTEQALALGLPKEKRLVALSMGIYKYTALTFEYARSTDYAVTDGGTGKEANSYTVQLAVGF